MTAAIEQLLTELRAQAGRKPCDPAAVDAVETELEVTFPLLLRRLYTEVGDGGFGPGEGIVPVRQLVPLWREYAEELAVEQELGEWPEALIPFCPLDNTLLACVDCGDPDGPVVGFEAEAIDFDEGTGFDQAFSPGSASLEEWLREWLAEPTPEEQFEAAFREAAEAGRPAYVSPEEFSEIVTQWFRDQGIEPPVFD